MNDSAVNSSDEVTSKPRLTKHQRRQRAESVVAEGLEQMEHASMISRCR